MVKIGEKVKGIDVGSFPLKAEMQVRAGTAAGVAGDAQRLTHPDTFSLLYIQAAKVVIKRSEPAVANGNIIASLPVPSSILYNTGGDAEHRLEMGF